MAEAQAADKTGEQLATATAHLAKFTEGLDSIQRSLSDGISHMEAVAEKPAPAQEMRVFYRVPRPFLEIIKAQFSIMKGWLEPITELTQQSQANTAEVASIARKGDGAILQDGVGA